jgi:uncharacterized MnhB-related membrane protein
MIAEILLLSLVIVSLLVVLVNNLLKALIILSASNLLIVTYIFFHKAPDVAITMAVVGTGATTILYLTIIKKFGGKHG